MHEPPPTEIAPDRSDLPDAEPTWTTADPSPALRRRGQTIAAHAFVWLITLLIATAATDAGLRLRQWTWQRTAPIHFFPDINRGYQWGREANGPQGLLNVYEKMARQEAYWPYFLDYAPLRLAVMRQWAAVNARTQAKPETWRDDYAFNRPVLWFNTGFEWVGAAAAFFLVRRWVRLGTALPPARSWPGEWVDRLRGRPAEAIVLSPPPFCGWGRGLIAGLLLWFNPAMILSTHGWPTWDAWVVPVYLLALLAGSYGRWFLAGVAVGIGAMFKGQQFVGAPVFLAWTLLNGDWRNALRWLAGVIVSIAAVAAPWLATVIPPAKLAELYAVQASGRGVAAFVVDRVWNVPALVWAGGVTVIAVLLPRAWRTGDWRWRGGAIAMAAVLVLCPLALRNDLAAFYALTQSLVLLVVLSAIVVRRADRAILTSAAAAGALLGGIYFFDASAAWWKVGIAYGSDHYQAVAMGVTDNLPGLLQERFGWRNVNEPVFTFRRPAWLPAGDGSAAVVVVTLKQFTRGLFVLVLLPCLWAVARQARRRDPRFLVAVVAPWLAFYCLPTQIHERYLLFAAAPACLWIGQSAGMTLLGFFLTVTTFMQTIHVMLSTPDAAQNFGKTLHELSPTLFAESSGQTLFRHLRATFPDLAWAHLLALAVVLYVAMTRTPKMRPINCRPTE